LTDFSPQGTQKLANIHVLGMAFEPSKWPKSWPTSTSLGWHLSHQNGSKVGQLPRPCHGFWAIKVTPKLANIHVLEMTFQSSKWLKSWPKFMSMKWHLSQQSDSKDGKNPYEKYGKMWKNVILFWKVRSTLELCLGRLCLVCRFAKKTNF